MNKIILIVFLILGITVNVFGATREKILRTGLVDTFAELDAIVADKALVNLADGGTFTGNIIANGNLSIGNAATTAGVLTLLEDTDAGSNFASFQVPALAANTIYTLPNAVGAAGNVLTDAAGNGILSWVEGGAGAGDITSVGDVATGAAFDGTQGTILTFYDVGGNMTLTYNGTTLTASKYITANVTGALTGNADTVTNGVYTGDAGTVFLAPAGDGASLTNVIHTEVDPTVDTAAEILTILDDTALDFGTGVLTATGFAGPLTGNADTVTNATLTTALTVNTGAVTLVGNAGASALTLGAGASSFSGTSSGTNTGGNTGDNTVCTSGTATTAATLATERAIYGNNFNGSAALTQVIASTYGGTGNGFTKFTGPTTAERVFTLPDATSTILYAGGALGTPSGGTLTSCTGLPYSGLANGTDGNLITWAADATIAVVATGDAGQVLTSGGVGVAPTFQAVPGGSSTLDDVYENGNTINADSGNGAVIIDGTGFGVGRPLDVSSNGYNIAKFTQDTQNNFQTGVGSFWVYSDIAVTQGYLMHLELDNADATNAVVLKVQHDGSGMQIAGTGNENLSNAGVWTDRTSLFDDKEDIIELSTPTYTDKLRNMKLFKYKKKCEIYGNKQEVLSETETIEAPDEFDDEGKKKDKDREKFVGENKYVLKGNKYHKVTGKEYPIKVRYKTKKEAKGYVGIILDDPSTAEELISRDQFGEINGKSGTQIAEFTLVVVKELISRIEELEAR